MTESPFDGLEVREGPPRTLPEPPPRKSLGCGCATFILVVIGCILFTQLAVTLGR